MAGKIVAVLTASGKGVIHALPIATGKLTNKNARPVKAGFQTLLPSPPKSDFATMIPNAAPSTVCQTGIVGGKTSARRIPVIIAEPSETVCFFFASKLNKNSKSTAEATLAKIVIRAGIPKITTP